MTTNIGSTRTVFTVYDMTPPTRHGRQVAEFRTEDEAKTFVEANPEANLDIREGFYVKLF
jgi:hypothetical protein